MDGELIEGAARAEVEMGHGPQFVYAFYLPMYRRSAEAQGRQRWPIKIGMTTTSVAVRMAAHRTALPEFPQLGLLVRTTDAALLEKVIHGILSLRGAQTEESGGSEWFNTNLEELISIYRFVEGDSRE